MSLRDDMLVDSAEILRSLGAALLEGDVAAIVRLLQDLADCGQGGVAILSRMVAVDGSRIMAGLECPSGRIRIVSVNGSDDPATLEAYEEMIGIGDLENMSRGRHCSEYLKKVSEMTREEIDWVACRDSSGKGVVLLAAARGDGKDRDEHKDIKA